MGLWGDGGVVDLDDHYESAVTQIKSAEEIKKFVVDESLSQLQRFLFLLEKGDSVQVHSDLNQLTYLLKTYPDPKDREVIYKKLASCANSNKLDEESNIILASQFEKLLKQGLLSWDAPSFSLLSLSENKCKITDQLFLRLCFPIVINGLQAKVSCISKAWNSCLIQLIPYLGKELMRKELLPLLRKQSDLRQTVHTRISACYLLARMATYYESSMMMQDLVPIVKKLCQDIEYEVRWNMSVNLFGIASASSADILNNVLLPELIEHTNDEEKVVKYKALHALVDFLQLLEDEVISGTVLPIIDKYIESTSLKHDPNVVEISSVYGKLCFHLNAHLSEDQKNYYLSFYRKLCVNGLTDSANQPERRRRDSGHFMPTHIHKPEVDKRVECRERAAFNLPAMFSFCGSAGYEQQLQKPLNSLVSDPAVGVRRRVASGFHELVKIMTPNAVLLEAPLNTLLNDKSVEIKAAITAHLDVILQYMYDASISHVNDAKLQNSVLDSIIECYHTLNASHDWRATERLIRHFCSIQHCFPDDKIYTKVYPLIYEIVTSHCAQPIKSAACESLARLIRCNRKFDQRTEMVANIVSELAGSGDSSAKRKIYIELCRCLARQFSRRFFKDHFMEPLLNLSCDKVIDVRLALSKVLPMVKSMLRLPGDRDLNQRLENALRNLIAKDYEQTATANRHNRSVTCTIRYYTQLCDQQDIPVESLLEQEPKTEEDLDDHKKEDDERFVETRKIAGKRRKTVGAVKVAINTATAPPTHHISSSSSPSTVNHSSSRLLSDQSGASVRSSKSNNTASSPSVVLSSSPGGGGATSLSSLSSSGCSSSHSPSLGGSQHKMGGTKSSPLSSLNSTPSPQFSTKSSPITGNIQSSHRGGVGVRNSSSHLKAASSSSDGAAVGLSSDRRGSMPIGLPVNGLQKRNSISRNSAKK